MSTEGPAPAVVAYEPSLGRIARTGTLKELATGTFRSAAEHATAGRFDAAAALVEVSVAEADELRDIYERWPIAALDWILSNGVAPSVLDQALATLGAVLNAPGAGSIQAEWPAYLNAVADAVEACRDRRPDTAKLVETARTVWQGIHDRAVDRMTGVIDIAVRTVGEDQVGALWDTLMSDWYAAHTRRYALTNQPWADSARQLVIAILDGFHAHLTGTARQGDIEVIEEPHRTGFRFAPCGSGGRSLDSRITAGTPRAGAPYRFAVTTRKHDWAWNTVGICTYCVHCCQLNELMPIDRLGYPTRVIDAPTWTPQSPTTSCTWWVYHDPSDVPDEVYRRVGRDPARRPAKQGEQGV
jgi:hypothetical protein